MLYNHPFPFSFRGVDLSTPAGEKWAFRALPPPLMGRINERVAVSCGGGDWSKRKVGPCVQTSDSDAKAIHVHHCKNFHLLYEGRVFFFYFFGHNFHKILYGERKQLCKSYNALVNYPGVSEVKRSRSESVFNCSWTRCANTRCRTTTHCKQSEGHFGWIRSSAGCLTHHPASLALPLFSALPLQHSLQKKPCSAG